MYLNPLHTMYPEIRMAQPLHPKGLVQWFLQFHPMSGKTQQTCCWAQL